MKLSEIENFFLKPVEMKNEELCAKLMDFLCEKEETPVDIAVGARVEKISRELYALPGFTGKYTARWTAISIYKEYWNTEESYDVMETHYFDRNGREHLHHGFDYYENGRWHAGLRN